MEEVRMVQPEGCIDVTTVFENYADMVYRLAFARVKNRYDADDILQEVFLRCLKMKNQPQGEEHLKALLIRITINCSKSYFTSAWFKKTEALQDGVFTEDSNCETLDAVLRLPVKYRTVVHLHYYCGYSVEEISEILHAKPSTVKSQLFRAREKLKTALKGVEF